MKNCSIFFVFHFNFLICYTMPSQQEKPYDFPDDTTLGTWKPDPDSSECGLQLSEDYGLRIGGGEIAKAGDFPFMALVGYLVKEKIRYSCGGSLINRRYVLTAAHCHTDKTPIEQVTLGELILGQAKDCDDTFCLPAPQVIDAEEVIIHPGWNPKNYFAGNDIALVRLEEPAVLHFDSDASSKVSPVCLPWRQGNPGTEQKYPRHATITGWGKVTNDNFVTSQSYELYNLFSRTLQKAKVPLVDIQVCAKDPTYVGKGLNTSLLLCAGEKGRSACQGDSGGPMVIKNRFEDEPAFQIGIISFGAQDCGSETPSFYTKVVSYLDWIAKEMKE